MIRLAFAFAAFIGVLIVLADTRNLGPLMVFYDFPYGDKIGHIVLYGTLTLLLSQALFRMRGRESARHVAAVCVVMLLLTSMEELSQLMFPARRPDWMDLAASYVGIGWFACLALFLLELKKLNQTGLRPSRS